MTLVYQSYRTHHVPDWIATCLLSVRKWAQVQNFDYRFIDDEMFTYAPQWYRDKVQDNVQLVSDLVRLILAKKFLEEGYDRVIWVDADMLVFDEQQFHVNLQASVAFCREIWIDEDLQRNIIYQKKINNSVSVFKKANAFVDFYQDACCKIVKSKSFLEPMSVGTEFLTSLNDIYPFGLNLNVGIITPALVYDLVNGTDIFIDQYLAWHGNRIDAANLCGSMKNNYFRELKIEDDIMSSVASRLLANKGLKVLNFSE